MFDNKFDNCFKLKFLLFIDHFSKRMNYWLLILIKRLNKLLIYVIVVGYD